MGPTQVRHALTDWSIMVNSRWVLLGVTVAASVAGGAAWLSGAPQVADYCWIAATLAAGLLPYTSGQVIQADGGLMSVRY